MYITYDTTPWCLPHESGDVPHIQRSGRIPLPSSPREWGCSPIVNKKARYHREIVESAMYSFEQGGNTLKMADTHPVYGWSYYHAQDPLSRLINMEARGED